MWLYWYNTSKHSSTQYTPYKIVYGRDPPTLFRYEKGSTAVLTLEEQLIDRDATLDDLKFHLLAAPEQHETPEG